ncbi:little elongation complex subunit 2 [Trematomus bernacchii]|uniref:little elongation complex subunit 2 n=1 Tax=Trematomus bernacchii TaxID=40690 RepID=UPI00146BFDBB|nr:little elongation complex subunit 2 [Trematomus bernacchii]
MELVWEDPQVPDAPFFTKDLYDKYSLAPNIRELWDSLQSPVQNIKQDCGTSKASFSSSSTKDAAAFKDNSCISNNESCSESGDTDDPFTDNDGQGAAECRDTEKSRVKLKQIEIEPGAVYPEPRLPYPCPSSLSINDQKTYLGFMMSKNASDPPKNLQARVNNEVMQFMRYLQEVGNICVDDYNFISQGAMQYSEEFFRGCLEHIRTFPELYQIHEMTSLTGGTFNPGLKLTFEKQLLIMGNVDITDHTMVPADAQLASDYQSVSSQNPPAKKAKDMHATISGDVNASSLCARYEPHVCLTRDALVRLLDNHGPDFAEQWELPVWIKLNPGEGNRQKKTVYIDSPLLKTEMTVKERSHVFHEESLKLSIKKNGSKNVFHLMTELREDEHQLSESSKRNVVYGENSGLDFEVDLTDLETFGETKPIKTPKMPKKKNEQDACVESTKASSSASVTNTKRSSERPANTTSSSQEEMDTSVAGEDDPVTEERNQPAGNEAIAPKTEDMRPDSAQECNEDPPFMGDSDEDQLVIDDSIVSPAQTRTTQCKPTPLSADARSDSLNSECSSPEKPTNQKRQSKKAKVSGDQLGDILRMQTAMFNCASDTAKSSTVSQEMSSPARGVGPSVHSYPTSLVKPCVSSYLERNNNQDGESGAASHESAPGANSTNTKHKKLLSEDLQAGAEDEQDYIAPEEGNLLYKLYSLQDLLLMVRSSVSLTHSRRVGQNDQNQYVPVHILPKLEYQLSYGVECLNSSEACQLWTETLLHSSTVPCIAHINALTSKVALLTKLPVNWKPNISCGFKPSKSLNILHHLLKKLTGLEEGQYLIAHKAGEPFVTLLKVANGKVSRGAYNLQQVHSSVPQPPTHGLVPWIPVDPSVVLPFHQKHGRVPCTFPPKPFVQTAKDGSSQSKYNNHGAGQAKNHWNAVGKRQNKNRAANRKKYIKNLLKKTF